MLKLIQLSSAFLNYDTVNYIITYISLVH